MSGSTGIQSDRQDGTIGLNCKSRIDRAARIQPHEVISAHAVHLSKFTADQELSVPSAWTVPWIWGENVESSSAEWLLKSAVRETTTVRQVGDFISTGLINCFSVAGFSRSNYRSTQYRSRAQYL